MTAREKIMTNFEYSSSGRNYEKLFGWILSSIGTLFALYYFFSFRDVLLVPERYYFVAALLVISTGYHLINNLSFTNFIWTSSLIVGWLLILNIYLSYLVDGHESMALNILFLCINFFVGAKFFYTASQK